MSTRLLASFAAAVSLFGAAAGARADSGPAPADPARAAGGFLARELARNGHVFAAPGTDTADVGVTIDAVLGLAATHTAPAEAGAATAAVWSGLADYLGPGLAPTELYAGPLAKSALLAQVVGEDPHHVAGRDLLAQLRSLKRPNGRYADRSAYGDASNTFTQALALLTLDRAGEPAPTAAVRFLERQQCTDGGFRLFVDAPDCVTNPDATAIAALALSAREPAAAGRALDRLEATMASDGGIAGGIGAETPNSNTTGLAASAFAAGGRDAAYERAAGFLRLLQFGCGAPESLRGAIAYDRVSYAALLAAGPFAQVSDQERRATTQAAFGLAGASPLTVTLAGATEVTDQCAGGGTSTSSSTSSTSSTSTGTTSTGTTSTGTTSTTSASAPTTTETVTVTETAPATAKSTETVTATVSTAVTITFGSGATGTAGPGTEGEAPDSSASTSGTAVAAPATPPPNSTGRVAYLLAGGLVLAGAAAAARILTRGRTH